MAVTENDDAFQKNKESLLLSLSQVKQFNSFILINTFNSSTAEENVKCEILRSTVTSLAALCVQLSQTKHTKLCNSVQCNPACSGINDERIGSDIM